MSAVNEKDVDPVSEMRQTAQSHLSLTLWGFSESYWSAKPGKLIYDSQWCRISFVWGGWDYLGGNSISIYYGRLHAPNEKATMVWNGEECHCWHHFEHALHFLDGHTPEAVSQMMYTHNLIEQFKKSDLGQSLTGVHRQPEWLVRMHAAVWEHYGKRLFEVFDLRRPELWQKYRQFLNELYNIAGRIPEIRPPLDKIC